MKEVTEPVYAARGEPLKGLRVVFALGVIVKQARKFGEEFASLPISSWPSIFTRRTAVQ